MTPHTEQNETIKCYTDQFKEGCALAQAVLECFCFDFVGVSLVPEDQNPELRWQCAAGNTNERYRRIILPARVGVLGIVFASRCSLLVRDVENDIVRSDLYQYPIVAAESLTGFFAFPLFEEERLTRILLCAFRNRQEFGETLLGEVKAFASKQSGLTHENQSPIMPRSATVEPVYTEITHKILQAQEEERKRVARELHDGLSQELLLTQIELRKLKYIPDDRKNAGIELASEKLREIMTRISEIATGLRPAALDELGLTTAIEAQSLQLQNSFGVNVVVKAEAFEPIHQDRETALYRIFQEAITNACKYSRSETIDVHIQSFDDCIKLSIIDHGIGFDTTSPQLHGGGLGLEGMRERAELFGGELRVDSKEGAGTCVSACMPREDIGNREGQVQ